MCYASDFDRLAAAESGQQHATDSVLHDLPGVHHSVMASCPDVNVPRSLPSASDISLRTDAPANDSCGNKPLQMIVIKNSNNFNINFNNNSNVVRESNGSASTVFEINEVPDVPR